MESSIVKAKSVAARIDKLKVLYDKSSTTAKRDSNIPLTVTLDQIEDCINRGHQMRYWMTRLNEVYKRLKKMERGVPTFVKTDR